MCVVHPVIIVLSSSLYLPYAFRIKPLGSGFFIFVYLLVASYIRGPMSCRIECTAHYLDAARLNHSTWAIALPPHGCGPPLVVCNFVVYYEKQIFSSWCMNEVRPPHVHQMSRTNPSTRPGLDLCGPTTTRSGSIPYMCTPPEFYSNKIFSHGCCLILSYFVPLKTGISRDSSATRSLQR